uniref:Reverse transcriptase domain-containing protein n=1 Tax=Tanacetum cinerariifolium TaxID=118510 RepID=A0A699H4Q5_TANCI|nr:reverse transcriptase domain-containing protein [Tanacetum cinerariifolium]
MRPRGLLRVLSDFDCKIRYHPGKASVAACTLSRNEQAKPLRVRALVMTINLNLPPQIHEARVEALMKENVKDENLYGMDKVFENRLDGTLCIRRRSWLPRVKNLGELIKHEPQKPNYFIHPGIG